MGPAPSGAGGVGAPGRCPNSGSVVPVGDRQERAKLDVRVPAELKRRLVEHAETAGISINAAVCVLLAEALDARDRR